MSTAIHPNATRNRIAKAQRVVAFIDAHPEIFEGTDIDQFGMFGPATWNLINTMMFETRPLSDLTVAAVLGILAGRA